ncbi:hypothetical protein AYI68_g1951 [Smittium mucronatum]|uniref:TRIP4/RQT4 C2HC5-type zinc finger domain-containing protein n=1 Tax=Smittium mucronatum TaxID=133383 RepID=A0A1R0H437_9FUNG|nr:hypothetical protein AYI68_g1951 [Smittium mucronatum]
MIQKDSFFHQATKEISEILQVSQEEAIILIKRFAANKNKIDLQNDILGILGYGEKSLNLASKIIEKYFPENTKKKENPTKFASKNKEDVSDYLQNSKILSLDNLYFKKEDSVKKKENEGTIALGYMKNKTESVFFEGKKKTKANKFSRDSSAEIGKERNLNSSTPHLRLQTQESLNRDVHSKIKNHNTSNLIVENISTKKVSEEKNPLLENSDNNDSKSFIKLNNHISTAPFNKETPFKNENPPSTTKSISDKKIKSNNKSVKSNAGKRSKREQCRCQALDHPLISNCANCGRIICEKEGFGPCFFCGNDVQSIKQQYIFVIENVLKNNIPDVKNIGLISNKIYQILLPELETPKGKKKEKIKKHKTSGSSSNDASQTRFLPPMYSSMAGGSSYVKSDKNRDRVPIEKNTEDSLSIAENKIDKFHFFEQEEAKNYKIIIESSLKDLKIDSELVKKSIKDLFDAINRSQRLLSLDINSKQTSKLIDEISDFDINLVDQWLTKEEKEEREAAFKAKQDLINEYEERRSKGIRILKLDIDGKTISYEKENMEELSRLKNSDSKLASQKDLISPKKPASREEGSNTASNSEMEIRKVKNESLKFLPQLGKSKESIKKISKKEADGMRGLARKRATSAIS